MGKAARIKRQQKTIPGIANSPYAGAFTTEEWEAALDRKDQMMRYFRDAVKVTDGTILGIDDATLQLLVLHAVLAGITHDEQLALIRPKVLPDEDGRLVDSVEWVPNSFDTPKARREDAREEARRRKAAMDVQMAQMTPAARREFREMFAPAAAQAFKAGARHAARYQENAAEETDEAKSLQRQAARLRQEGKL
jgi:hypothetical protein